MGLPCPHPFPWDAMELIHRSSGAENLSATHLYCELCPAAVMETPIRDTPMETRFWVEIESGRKKPHNNPGNSWGY